MSSVGEYITCPLCKSDRCSEDFDYKTTETFIDCTEYGYRYHHIIVRDDDGQLIIGPKGKLYWDDIYIKNPFGVVEIKYKNDTRATHYEPFETEHEFDSYITGFMASKPETILTIILSCYIDGKIMKKLIYPRNQ